MSKYSNLIKKVDLFHKLACFSDRKSFLETLGQTGPTYQVPEQVISVPPVTRVPEQVISVPKTTPRVVSIQNALNALKITSNDGKPLAPDGEYGPLTGQAVNKFMKNFNIDSREDAIRTLSQGPNNVQQALNDLLKAKQPSPQV